MIRLWFGYWTYDGSPNGISMGSLTRSITVSDMVTHLTDAGMFKKKDITKCYFNAVKNLY